MTRIIIVRHGDTFGPGEVVRRIGARTDLPLAPGGHRQAERLGLAWAKQGLRFDRVWTSPLLRTRQTATAILAHQVDPVVPTHADELLEIDHGPDEDEPEAAVVARHGAEALRRWERQMIPPAGWVTDAERRVAWWRTLYARQTSGTVLVVTSNGAARFALLAGPGLPWNSTMKLRTGAWGEMLRGADASMTVTCWNVRPDDHPQPAMAE